MFNGTFFFPYEGFLTRSTNERLFLKDGALDFFYLLAQYKMIYIGKIIRVGAMCV